MKHLVSTIVILVLLTFSVQGLAQLSSLDYLPVPANCGNIGPNLVVNPEFEEGNVGFQSSFLFRPDGVCYWGDYTIATTVKQPGGDFCYDVPPTYIPSLDFPTYLPADEPFNLRHIWSVTQRLRQNGLPFPGQGLFMIVDPCDPLGNSLTDSCSAADPTDGRIWQQSIKVCAGEDYAFSVFAKNIYASDAYQWPGAGVQPDFELSINGSPITNYFVDGVPGQNGSFELPQTTRVDSNRWFQISGVYQVPAGTDSVTLVIRNLVQGKDGNDLALDGLFFGLCGRSVELNVSLNIPQCDLLGNIEPIRLKVSESTQNSDWKYYEWTKDGSVELAGRLGVGDRIPDYITTPNLQGKFFGDYQLITYTDTVPSSTCENASQLVQIVDSCDANFVFPVEMGMLTGKMEQGRAKLSWETFSESNNDGFEIEISTDGTNFDNIGFVSGAGNSDRQQVYGFTTDRLPLGKHYFRIRQVDIDGTSTLSNSIALTATASEILVDLYPNPARDMAQIILDAKNDDYVKVELISPLGQLVETVYEGWVLKGKKIEQSINTAGLPSGIYHVRLKGARSNGTYKLVVTR